MVLLTNSEIDLDTFCRKWKVLELSVFGSAARDELRPDSDIDLLVSFEETAEWDLLDMLRMQDEAEALLGRRVDLVSRRGVERGGNWIVRNEILNSAERIYAKP